VDGSPETAATFVARRKPVLFLVVDDRERRIARNEAHWRQVNELAPPEPGFLNLVFCECGRAQCGERVAMTVEEYDGVRASPTTFLVAPGHELEDVERVVGTTDRYRVVEKLGEAAAIVVETDPT
jgi:hypothetical protein